jgi:hypothetical protein
MKIRLLALLALSVCGVAYSQSCTPPPGTAGCAVLGGAICGGSRPGTGSCPITWTASRGVKYCTPGPYWCEWDLSECPQCQGNGTDVDPDNPEEASVMPDKWKPAEAPAIFLPAKIRKAKE